MKDWERFTAGRAPAGPGVADWSPLVSVTHSTHLLPAIRIAEDRSLSAELIYDGVLQATRTKVVYFSPNTWGEGSRYGAFDFTVDWKALLAGRQLYWVEAIRTYKYAIYRLLLTNKSVGALPVIPYDPVSDDGPIRKTGDDWFWATGYAAEVVVDEDVPLHEVTKLAFGRHHDSFCSERGSGKCPERGHEGTSRAIRAFIGVLLGRDIHSLDALLTDDRLPSADCYHALSNTWPLLIRGNPFGGPVTDAAQALDVVRAAALMIQAGDRERVKRLMGLIADEATADSAYLQLIREHFDAPSFTWTD